MNKINIFFEFITFIKLLNKILNHSPISFKAKQFMAYLCYFKFLNKSPVSVCHILAIQSELAVIRYSESQEKAQSHTHLECPYKILSTSHFYPYFSFGLLFHNFTVLSAEQEAKYLLIKVIFIIKLNLLSGDRRIFKI